VRRASFIAGLAGAIALGWSAPASAGVPVNIDVYDWMFLPDVAEQSALGTGVIWNWNGGSGTTQDEHNVREDSKMFRSPLRDQGTFSISPSAGTYHYYCEPHLLSNQMEGKLKIMPAYTELSPDQLRITWAQEESDTGDRFDVLYRIGEGPFKTWHKRTAKRSGRFGRLDEPVDVKPGKTYSFKARTSFAAKPSKQSNYSPLLVVDVPAR
jgi:plastocyanin